MKKLFTTRLVFIAHLDRILERIFGSSSEKKAPSKKRRTRARKAKP